MRFTHTSALLLSSCLAIAPHLIHGQRVAPLLIDPEGLPDLPTASQAQSAADDVGLNLTDIQGDILVGMKKNKELFFFFNITDATAFKSALGSSIVPLITSATQLLASPAPSTAVNIAFSHTGLTALGNTDNLQDSSYTNGQLSDATRLGDPGTGNWVPNLPFANAVFLIASGTVDGLDAQLADIQSALGSSITEVYRLNGAARPGAELGHEHFGFLDGVSQPAVDGFSANVFPGQASIAPGFILVAENGDSLSASRPPWTKSGSFLAFRQLKQQVPEFNKFLLDNAITDNNMTTEEGAELLGARMVGRWKSGAPVDLTPTEDNVNLANDTSQNNNFDFSNPDGSPLNQTRCPFSAHIRKTNPRADLPRTAVDLHRIMRAGIPYGPEVTDGEAASNSSDPNQERGLAFVAYQSNINNGFAFLQQTWANNVNFLQHDANPVGFDPIIGANGGMPRNASGVFPSAPTQQLTMMFDFVVSRGGEYFFSPTVSAIQNTLAV